MKKLFIVALMLVVVLLANDLFALSFGKVRVNRGYNDENEYLVHKGDQLDIEAMMKTSSSISGIKVYYWISEYEDQVDSTPVLSMGKDTIIAMVKTVPNDVEPAKTYSLNFMALDPNPKGPIPLPLATTSVNLIVYGQPIGITYYPTISTRTFSNKLHITGPAYIFDSIGKLVKTIQGNYTFGEAIRPGVYILKMPNKITKLIKLK